MILNVIKCFIFAFGALFIIFMSTGGKLLTFKHVLIYSMYSIPLCFLYAYTVYKFGSILGNILSGWSSRRASPREALSADLERARFSKRKGLFREALDIINEVLEKDPDFPDAQYLKAVILWEGFEDQQGALKCLREVMRLVPRKDTLHRWASNYYDEVTGSEKRRQTHSSPKRE